MADQSRCIESNVQHPPKHAFVDAYGDPGLNIEKDSSTTMFIVAAVVVDGASLDDVAAGANVIRERYFGKGPIKSKRVSDEKRLRVLSDLCDLDFRFVAVALDKARVIEDGDLLYPGLRYPKSFVKFVHSKVFDRLFARSPDIRVLCDRYGYPEFMESFRRYVLAKREDLFHHPTFAFDASTNNVLIQIADFVAGSLSRIYDAKKLSPFAEEIHALLIPKALKVIDWPKRFRNQPPPIRAESEFDEAVRRYCLEQAQAYVAENSDSEDEEVATRVDALEYLLFWYDSEGDRAWLATERLREYLAETCPQPPSTHNVRSKIIAPLRDSRVLIASSKTHGGYKIPASVNDVLSFVERYETIAVPMLNRVRSAREALYELTDGKLDILEDERFAQLREALDGRLYGAIPDILKKAG